MAESPTENPATCPVPPIPLEQIMCMNTSRFQTELWAQYVPLLGACIKKWQRGMMTNRGESFLLFVFGGGGWAVGGAWWPGKVKLWRSVFEKTVRGTRVLASLTPWRAGPMRVYRTNDYLSTAAILTRGFGGKALVEWYEAAQTEAWVCTGFTYCSFQHTGNCRGSFSPAGHFPPL